jgi:anti-anti-sigma regulatory factor
MSITSPTQAHIAYELVDNADPPVVVIEFVSGEIAGPVQAGELGEQLESLLRSDLPRNFVIDFSNARSLGSTAFSVIVSFAREVEQLQVCNIPKTLELGAMLIGLEAWAVRARDRRAAIDGARRAAERVNPVFSL